MVKTVAFGWGNEKEQFLPNIFVLKTELSFD